MGRVVVHGQCYEWDDEKRRRTLRKHGVDFAELPAALEADAVFEEDLDHSADEDRWRALTSCSGRIVMVIYTWRQDCVDGGVVFHLYRSSVDHGLIVVTDGTTPTKYVNCPNGGRWLKFKSFAETGTRRVDFSEKIAKADIRKRGFHLIHVAPAVSAAE